MGRHHSAPQIPDADIFIDIAAVKRRTSYGLQQIARMEDAGTFPRRARIAEIRIGWSLAQVIAWMQTKLDARHKSPSVVLTAQDRFIATRELKSIVLLHPNTIRRLEYKGTFPRRIELSGQRVVWLQSEILQWMEEKLEPRRFPTTNRILEDQGTFT